MQTGFEIKIRFTRMSVTIDVVLLEQSAKTEEIKHLQFE